MSGKTEERLPTLKLGTGWVPLEVIGELDVVMTFKGYAPVIPVKATRSNLEYTLYIQAKSIAEGLEPMRKANAGSFLGLRFQLRKTSDEKFATYEFQDFND